MRKWGQHFLIAKATHQKIVAACELSNENEVLEIGPGQGELTQHYIHRVSKTVLVEIDPKLCEQLRKRWNGFGPLSVIHADFRKLNLDTLSFKSKPVVISDLPYYASKPLLRKILEWSAYRQAILTFQKEVALRLTAQAGQGPYGALSLIAQLYASVQKLFDIAPNEFYPPPKVTSSVVRLRPATFPLIAQERLQLIQLIKMAFRQSRKTLANNLASATSFLAKKQIEKILESCSISPTSRAHQINLATFQMLAKEFYAAQPAAFATKNNYTLGL